jgi:hypothetical protein
MNCEMASGPWASLLVQADASPNRPAQVASARNQPPRSGTEALVNDLFLVAGRRVAF